MKPVTGQNIVADCRSDAGSNGNFEEGASSSSDVNAPREKTEPFYRL